MTFLVNNAVKAPQNATFGTAACVMALLVLWTPVFAGCGTASGASDSNDASTRDSTDSVGDTGQDSAKVCDGSGQIRLYFRSKPLWGQMGEFDNVYFENGFSYFIVDGTCRYWAFSGFEDGGSHGKWNDVLSGQLTDQQAASLGMEVQWNRLESVDGHYENRDVHHGGVFQITDGRSGMLSCEIECPDEEKQEIIDAAKRWHRWMLTNGSPRNHKLRGILALEPEDIQRTYDSAVDLPEQLKPLVIDEPAYFGAAACPGKTTVFPIAVQDLLHELRHEYRSGEHGFFRGFIPMVNDEGKSIQLHIRPSIEPEDESGLISFGFGPPSDEIENSGNPCPSSSP